MKIFINLSSIFIMLLSFSSITSAQGPQRPSQRSFATVLEKIKEKQEGRNRARQRQEQPEDNVGKTLDPTPPANTATIPPAGTQQLPSKQPIRKPALPRKD